MNDRPGTSARMHRGSPRGYTALLAVGVLLLLANCTGSLRQEVAASATPSSRDRPMPAQWEVEYHVSGGLAGVQRQLIFSSGGALIAEDLRTGVRVEMQVQASRVAEIAELMQAVDRSRIQGTPSIPTNRCADCFQHGLTVTIDGRKWKQRLDDLTLSRSPSASLVARLSSLLQEALAGRNRDR